MRAPKPCLWCGALTHTGPRCRRCEQQHQQAREANRSGRYGPEWRRARAAAIQAHIAQHGLWCPGYGRPPHPAADLTGDHRADGTIGVYCRSCNARKGIAEPVFKR